MFSGAPIPVPYTTLGYAYGISNSTTGYAHLHTTSLLFSNLQLDLGSTIKIFEKENKFGFSCSPALQVATSLKAKNSFRLWPSTDLNFYFHPKDKSSYFYSGLNTWYDLSSKKAHNENQNAHVFPNLQLGYVIVKQKYLHQFQISYLGLGTNNLPNVVSFVGIANKGSLGFHYSFIRKIK
jgi:hypothetical protein